MEPVLAFNRRLYDRCKQVGGSQYPISAIRLGPDDWAVHYGEQWDRLLRPSVATTATTPSPAAPTSSAAAAEAAALGPQGRMLIHIAMR